MDSTKLLPGFGLGVLALGLELSISLGSSLVNLIGKILPPDPSTASEISLLLLAPAVINLIHNLIVRFIGVVDFEKYGGYTIGFLAGDSLVLVFFALLFGYFLPDVVANLAVDFIIVASPLIVVTIIGLSRGERRDTAGYWP